VVQRMTASATLFKGYPSSNGVASFIAQGGKRR
jgi:hypothetical protein